MSQQLSQNKVLFLSGVDFKERSIQVIRKTPEAYVHDGWEVHYVVGRDTSKAGDYFYESIINPPGIIIHRFSIPLASVHGFIKSKYWAALWFRVRNILLYLTLAWYAIKLSRKVNFNVLYGYEIPGVVAARLCRMFGYFKSAKLVTRFQGVLYIKEWLRRNEKFRLISNWDALLALRTKADLCIMTNDGSQGLDVLKKVKSPNQNILFVSNGVDPIQLDSEPLDSIKAKFYSTPDHWYFISVSRLDNHKRIDRGIRIINVLVNTLGIRNITFTVIGGGAELDYLQSLTDQFKLNDHVCFLGPIKFDEVKYHLKLSHIFISMYTSTNVGNPLLEAIQFSKIIVTLANGDTPEWIQHLENGLIFPVDDDKDLGNEDYITMAGEIRKIIVDTNSRNSIQNGIEKTRATKLWSWDERFKAELDAVHNLFLR